MMRIEIAGALSCGKSTLAGKLAANGYLIVYEDLTTNPYLDLRVEDPARYDFLCQRQFVLDKIASLQSANESGKPYIADFSIAAERAYVSHYVSHRPDWIGFLNSMIDECERSIGQPDLLVHLECDPQAQLERIRKRGREFEQGHDVTFISNINDRVSSHVERVRARGVQVISYRTDLLDWSDILTDLSSLYLPKLGFVALGGGSPETTAG
jgi:deoxyadenosine/deoxycytidine kinase